MENPEFAPLLAAANGDRSALADMTLRCIAKPLCGVPTDEAMCFAEVFARLAAMHDQSDDLLMLAGVLFIRSRHCAQLGDEPRAESYLSEVTNILDHVTEHSRGEGLLFLTGALSGWADDGDEDAAFLVNRLMEGLTPAEAAELRRDMRPVAA